jgi:hypothetical protein
MVRGALFARAAQAAAALAVVVITLSMAGDGRRHVSFVLDLGYLQLVLET